MRRFAAVVLVGILLPGCGREVPARTGLWAVLVAATAGTENLRHQRDVAEQHDLLRANGVSEDRIIVVTAGEIPIAADYRMQDLTASDIGAIVAGRTTVTTPDVVEAGPGDDVYVFVAGHGAPEGIELVGSEEMLTPDLVRDAVASRSSYRHVLLAVEACNAATFDVVGELPRTAVLTASTATEKDYASADGATDAFAHALADAAREGDRIVAHVADVVGEQVALSTVGLAGSNSVTSLAVRDFVAP